MSRLLQNTIVFERNTTTDMWTVHLEIVTSHDSFHQLMIVGPSQTIVMEMAKSMMKPAIWGHKKYNG